MYYNLTSYFGRWRYQTLILFHLHCYFLNQLNRVISKCWASQYLFIALLIRLHKSYWLLSQFIRHNHYIPFLILLNFSFTQFPVSLSLFLSILSNWIRFSTWWNTSISVLFLWISSSWSYWPPFLQGLVLLGEASVLSLPSTFLLWRIPLFLTGIRRLLGSLPHFGGAHPLKVS